MLNNLRPQYYILDSHHRPVPVDRELWSRWFSVNAARVVKQEDVGDVSVSTVFLGLDHNWNPSGPPILFETEVFWNGQGDDEMDRCSTWDEAVAMHERMVAKVKAKGAAQ